MHREHREQYLARLAEARQAAVIPTATLKTRNHDTEYRFRPDSDFWYLTGFAEPQSTLVLLPGLPEAQEEAARQPRSVLFLRERDPEMEVWTGRRLGVERALEALGVDEARPAGELWTALPKLLRGYERIVYRTGQEPDRDRRMLEVVSRLRAMAKRDVLPPAELVDTAPVLHELRLHKGPRELDRMRKAAEISREAHVAAMRATAPGMHEYQIDALLEYTFRRHGATGAAYTNIVAGGANACILHYVQNDAELRDGDLLLVDAGAEWDYYASDVTRTYPINGTFSAEQRALYQLVLDAQLAAIDKVRPGESIETLHDTAVERLVHGLLELGLLEGSAEGVIEEKAYRRFYMHGTGHWLGLDVHDCGAHRRDGAARLLEPGMVTTVEPGLYVAPDDETVEPHWRGIGVRIEDDVLVTTDGREVLTAGIPKSIEEVEATCQGRSLEPVA